MLLLQMYKTSQNFENRAFAYTNMPDFLLLKRLKQANCRKIWQIQVFTPSLYNEADSIRIKKIQFSTTIKENFPTISQNINITKDQPYISLTSYDIKIKYPIFAAC